MLADTKMKAGSVRNGDIEEKNLEATNKVAIFLLLRTFSDQMGTL